jgi:hypothetical protein
MLAEFALTPSIFDETRHADKELWRDQLRELGANMFPRTAPWPVMISNLYGGSWESVALQVVQSIKDQKARVLCEDLLQNAAKTLVHRPVHHDDWPGEDGAAWGREAISSHSVEPIDRVVACRPAHKVLAAECRFIRSIDEVREPSFWNDITSSWSQTMKIGDQIDSLRKLCVHSEFLCLITPHIYGGSDDETDFVVKLIESCFRRPAGFVSVEVEVHTEAPDKPAGSDYPTRLANRTHALKSSWKQALIPGHKARLVLWPKLLDRFVIAGVYTELGPGKRVRSPRWGVSLQHIARKADERASIPPTHWSLLARKELGDQFQQYCKDGVSGCVRSDEIMG